MYLLEGIYTILLAGVVFLVLPDYPKSPRSSKFLTPREQEYLEVRLSENAPLTHEKAFSKTEVMASLSDPRTYSFMLNQLLVSSPAGDSIPVLVWEMQQGPRMICAQDLYACLRHR